MQTSDLISAIAAAFASVPYPGDENIVADDSPADLETSRVKNRLQGRHWREVSGETIEQLQSALPLLTAAAYRFYLPAFMTFALLAPGRSGSVRDELVRTLTRPDPADLEKIKRDAAARRQMNPLPEAVWNAAMQALAAAHESGELEGAFRDRVAALNADQAKAVSAFLEHLRDEAGDKLLSGEAAVALDRYWSAHR